MWDYPFHTTAMAMIPLFQVRLVGISAFETGLLVAPLLSRAILQEFFGARAGTTAERCDLLDRAAGLGEVLDRRIQGTRRQWQPRSPL